MKISSSPSLFVLIISAQVSQRKGSHLLGYEEGGRGIKGRELPSQGGEGHLLLFLLFVLFICFENKSQVSQRERDLISWGRREGDKEGGVALSGRRGRFLPKVLLSDLLLVLSVCFDDLR